MDFPYNVYGLAVLSSFLVSLSALPLWRRYCVRIGLVDDPGHRKIHAESTPLAGGLTVASGLLLPILAGAFALWLVRHAAETPGSLLGRLGALLPLGAASADPLTYGLGRRFVELGGILLGAIGMLTLGCLDDKYELKPKTKFAGQLLIALLVAATGVRITLFVPSQVFSFLVTVFWILTVINAFNFMDNMNGLCAGLGAVGAAFFALFAALAGQYLVALIAFLTLGALLGFLPHNYPRAKAFLGDSGSHLVGYLLAILAILPHFHTPEQPRRWAVLMPLLVLAVPLLDLAWVVVLRWRMGKPFYVGDTNHLSHRLVRSGYRRETAVLLIWLLAATAGSLALLWKFLA